MLKKLLSLSFAFTAIFPIYSFAERSPFELLKKRFEKAHLPHEMHFRPGYIWHCSSSLEAAKGHFRNVQFWFPNYVFEFHRDRAELKNLGPHIIRTINFENNEVYGLFDCPSCISPRKQSFRVTHRGDLLVAHFKMQKKERRRYGGESDATWSIDHYSVCENPDKHDDQDWDSGHSIWGDI